MHRYSQNVRCASTPVPGVARLLGTGSCPGSFQLVFSCGVAATLCGMEDGCVCAAASCDSSRWPF